MSDVRLMLGDCLDVLPTLAEKSVHCCITSPPYYGLRDYSCDGQIGLEETPEDYVGRMVAVFREVRRVLRDDGTLWLNLGDSFNSSPSNQQSGTSPGPYGDGAFRSQGRRKREVPGLKTKDLLGIPWRVAFALQADGAADPKAVRVIARLRAAILDSYEAWEDVPAPVRRELDVLDAEYAQAKAGSWYLRSDIIWHKPNPMPESVRDRPTKAHEYLFLLSKSERYHYDADAIKEDAVYSGANAARKDAGRIERETFGDLMRTRSVGRTCGYPERRNRRSVFSVETVQAKLRSDLSQHQKSYIIGELIQRGLL